MPNLIVERGREKGQTFELAAGATVVVGRDPQGAQIVIADAAASRRHFQVTHRAGKWFVADLGSKNATYRNEEKLEKEMELSSGDQIQVGETVFTFNDDAKADDKSAGLAGKELGGYKILNRIGRGGMGTVFKAKQVSLNRLVALKFLSPKLSKDPAFVAKFFAEARAAAQLNHPNVVQVFDVGTLSGVHFFSMEIMEGGCVQDLLSAREDSRLPWTEALPIIVEATRGLVFAEKRGIVHRDIKPDNLMLSSEQKVKIGDLGLATSAEAETEKGIFGTPHFIAPEQAQGKEVTHAADLYSLGATFYRMVCGKTPFTGATVKDILRAQINDPHQPVTQIVPDFPPELAAIIDKMMAKKVENRYQSATKLLEDLEAFQLAHQIELAGGVKSKKPFLIVMGILGVALASVIIYAATRDPEIEIVKERGKTVIVKEGPVGPVKTEDDIRREQEAAAKDDYFPIKERDLRLGEISLAKKDEWDGIQKDYDGLRAKHPKAEAIVGEAEARAKTIRERLDELDTLQRTVVDAAKKWWQTWSDQIKSAAGNGLWADAIAKAKAAGESEEFKKHQPYLEGTAKSWFDGIADDCFKLATQEHSDVMKDAERLLGEGKVVEAIHRVDEWEKKVRNQPTLPEAFKLFADQAKQWRDSKTAELETKLREQLQSDKAVFVEAYRKVRHFARDDKDDGGPVFAYRFADAAKELRAATTGRVKSWMYLERVESTAARLDASQAAWDAVTKLISEKKLWAPGEEIKGVPGVAQGTKVTIDPDKPATGTEMFVLLSITGGSTKKTLQYDDFVPAELFKVLLQPRLDRIAPELALELARAFAVLGDELSAGVLLDRAKPMPEQVGWLIAEIRAMQDYDRLVQSLTASQPQQVVRDAVLWQKTYFRTDFFILQDGRSAEEMPQLYTDEDIEKFVDAFGEKK